MIRSRQETASFQCPLCRAAFEAPVWIVLDAEERPALLTALLDGTLHQATCPQCGAIGTISAPLLYHDGRQQRVVLAVPLSVETAVAAQELAEQLVGYLHAAFEAAGQSVPAYLSSVELVADIDGLQAILTNPETDAVVAALEAVLATHTAEDFQAQVVQHRTALMTDDADAVFAALIEQARNADDHGTARRIADQRATLNRLRATLQARQAALAAILATLPTTPEDVDVLPTLRSMLHASDPQQVYAARLQLTRADQARLDALLDRMISATEHTRHDGVLDFLFELRRLRDL